MNITWRSPSNIALIKYWGKYGRQLPRNASISFTLQNAFTETSLSYKQGNTLSQIQLKFQFAGAENELFRQKMLKFMNNVSDEMPFLLDYELDIKSYNSFPHSAGIASSASSMSALALCLCTMGQEVGYWNDSEAEFLQRASYFARLASGSAARSVYPVAAVWGDTPHIEAGNNEYAIPYKEHIHPIFHSYYDDILLVSQSEKSVSSTAGHSLMDNNPYAPVRYQQAEDNLGKLLAALKTGDLETFGQLVEEEALTLHALMMSSRPAYILLEPNTITLIRKIQQWRLDTRLPLCFSLDAGPNLHLLYPESIHTQVQHFIQEELLAYCQNQQHLTDKVGNGASKL